MCTGDGFAPVIFVTEQNVGERLRMQLHTAIRLQVIVPYPNVNMKYSETLGENMQINMLIRLARTTSYVKFSETIQQEIYGESTLRSFRDKLCSTAKRTIQVTFG